MADLQCSMDRIWKIVRGRAQDGRENSDTDASPESDFSEKFSDPESAENIIRSDLGQIGPI
jgi:hypothetical protein